jgi:hypothetical protein
MQGSQARDTLLVLTCGINFISMQIQSTGRASGLSAKATVPILYRIHCAANAPEKILERAKGFEPSTPTLARSCSTTELHPHPGAWRRSRAGNGQSYAKCGP